MKIKLLYPNFKSKALTFSFDDGSVHDKRLIEILDKYHLKATFNLNTGLMNQFHLRNNKDCSILDLNKNKAIYKNHEIASHSFNHPHLEELNKETIKECYLKDINNLKSIFNLKEVNGSAYPYGTYSLETIEVLKELGVKYARTTRSTKSFALPSSFLVWHPTSHFLSEDIEEIIDRFKLDNNELSLLYLWGHSYELEVNQKFDYFEEIAKKLSEIDDLYIATNYEIYEYINAVNLIYISSNRIYNPSKLKVYLKINDENYSINPNSYLDYDKNVELSLIFMGDSLMQENYMDTYPQKGWPQGFIEAFNLDKTKTKYRNYAKNGRSTKSFIDENRFNTLLKDINPNLNNYCFISFGHNDEKEDKARHTSYEEYKANLNYFIDELEKRKIKVILLTSITRLKYLDNKLIKTHLDYPKSMKEVAKERNIPLIDLESLTFNYLKDKKYEDIKDLFMIFDKDTYPNYLEGKSDTTHLSFKGMRWINNLIKSQIEIKNNELIIKKETIWQ